MSATIKKLLMVLILSGIPGRSYALCTDQRHPSVQAEFKQSKYVVIATVKSYRYVRSPEDPEGYAATIYRVVVDRVFRGAPGAKK